MYTVQGTSEHMLFIQCKSYKEKKQTNKKKETHTFMHVFKRSLFLQVIQQKTNEWLWRIGIWGLALLKIDIGIDRSRSIAMRVNSPLVQQC